MEISSVTLLYGAFSSELKAVLAFPTGYSKFSPINTSSYIFGRWIFIPFILIFTCVFTAFIFIFFYVFFYIFFFFFFYIFFFFFFYIL